MCLDADETVRLASDGEAERDVAQPDGQQVAESPAFEACHDDLPAVRVGFQERPDQAAHACTIVTTTSPRSSVPDPSRTRRDTGSRRLRSRRLIPSGR